MISKPTARLSCSEWYGQPRMTTTPRCGQPLTSRQISCGRSTTRLFRGCCSLRSVKWASGKTSKTDCKAKIALLAAGLLFPGLGVGYLRWGRSPAGAAADGAVGNVCLEHGLPVYLYQHSNGRRHPGPPLPPGTYLATHPSENSTGTRRLVALACT